MSITERAKRSAQATRLNRQLIRAMAAAQTEPVLVAIDSDTGKMLNATDAQKAADNPGIYTWVRWVASGPGAVEQSSVLEGAQS